MKKFELERERFITEAFYQYYLNKQRGEFPKIDVYLGLSDNENVELGTLDVLIKLSDNSMDTISIKLNSDNVAGLINEEFVFLDLFKSLEVEERLLLSNQGADFFSITSSVFHVYVEMQSETDVLRLNNRGATLVVSSNE